MKQKVQALGEGLVTVIDRVSVSSGIAAGIVMFMIALMTGYDVILRYVFDKPTTWVFTATTRSRPLTSTGSRGRGYAS